MAMTAALLLAAAPVFAEGKTPGVDPVTEIVITAPQTLGLNDVELIRRPPPSRYQPEGTTLDLHDQGKSFDVSCMVADDGRMRDCAADENDMVDQNFVDIAVADISQIVVGPEAVDGTPTAGKRLLVTCAFRRLDVPDAVSKLAAADNAR